MSADKTCDHCGLPRHKHNASGVIGPTCPVVAFSFTTAKSDTIDGLLADNERLREALRPFAELADEMERVGAQHAISPDETRRRARYAHCERARAALTSSTERSNA